MSNESAQIDVGQALAVAERMLGRRPDRVEPFQPAVGGDDSYSFRLWVGSDAMLLKIKKRPGSPIGVYFHRRLKDAGVPVPELIAFDAGAGPNEQASAIWEWIDGKAAQWQPDGPCPYDEGEMGEILRRIHELKFDGDFGFLGDDISNRTFTCTPDCRRPAGPGQACSCAIEPPDATLRRATSTSARPTFWQHCRSDWRISFRSARGACCTWATSCATATRSSSSPAVAS